MLSPVKLWRNQKKIRELLGQEGKIVSYTTIRIPPAGFEDQAPYVVILVDLGDKQQIGQLVDTDDRTVKIGQKVRAILRRVRKPTDDGVIAYGIKWVLQ